MLNVVNEKIDELIQSLKHCKVDETHDIKDKLLDLNHDLDSFKKQVCSVQKWIKSGLEFFNFNGPLEIDKSEKEDI